MLPVALLALVLISLQHGLSHPALGADVPPRVLAVSPPVWLQRGEASAPLLAGTVLQKTDVISVGATGGAVIHIDEIRLGLQSNTTWLFPEDADSDKQNRSAGTLLQGGVTIDSTNALPKSLPIRLNLFDLADKPATFAAGSYAGALVTKRESSICLTKGSASFDGVRLVDKAGHRFPPDPVQAEQTDDLSECYSIAAGGAEGLWLTQDGRWRVNLVASDNTDAANSLLAYLRNNGFPATVEPTIDGGVSTHQVSIPGFSSRAAAAAMASELRGRLPGISAPWVSAVTAPPAAPVAAAPMLTATPSAVPQARPRAVSKVATGKAKKEAVKKPPARKKPVKKLRKSD